MMHINLHLKWFWLNLGWYPGEELALFGLTIGEVVYRMNGSIDLLAVLEVRVLRFLFAFGLQKR